MAPAKQQAALKQPKNDRPESDEADAPANDSEFQAPEADSDQGPPTKKRRGVNGEAEDVSGETGSKPKAADKKHDPFRPKPFTWSSFGRGSNDDDEGSAPMNTLTEIYTDMMKKALAKDPNQKLRGFGDVLHHQKTKLKGRPIVMATMCSGTEAPLFAMGLLADGTENLGRERLQYKHAFSAEIEPFKQAYIERNFSPDILFRDVTELLGDSTHATTAYGASKEIPGKIDLLVVGSSCVDFSALNGTKTKEEVQELGESAATFSSIVAYARRFRPTIIVLENVRGAPWDKFVAKFDEIKYAAQWCPVDTKDYYIPQTRQRGYMVCLDRKKYTDAAKRVEMFPLYMRNLRRPASCSFEEFLLPVNDPRMAKARKTLGLRDGDLGAERGIVRWDMYQRRHDNHRREYGLGPLRPTTRWINHGTCMPPDNFWFQYFSRQTERVWDTVDIACLRTILRGYDLLYKARPMDLSQGIDRTEDNTAGLVGCLTPRGIPFHYIRGALITGLEALALQGLPLNKIQLTRETQTQLQDLAGNAMSTTTVASAMISALILGFEGLSADGGEDASARSDTTELGTEVGPEVGPEVLKETGLEEKVTLLSAYEPMSAQTALTGSARSRRLCTCEGIDSISQTAMFVCTDCQHTCCAKCKGNPEHNYRPFDPETLGDTEETRKRTWPHDFEADLRKSLPRMIELPDISRAVLDDIFSEESANINVDDWNTIKDTALRAFESKPSIRSVVRTNLWTVTFLSEHARVELIISDSIEWRIYALPCRKVSRNAHIREVLQHPVARMRVDKYSKDIAQGSWEFWLPNKRSFNVWIEGVGDPRIRSFQASCGLEAYTHTFVYPCLSVSGETKESSELGLDGTYNLLRKCGTPMGVLHVKAGDVEMKEDPTNAPATEPLYLFLHSDRLANPWDDPLIFSSNPRFPDLGKERELLASLDPIWRPPIIRQLPDGCLLNSIPPTMTLLKPVIPPPPGQDDSKKRARSGQKVEQKDELKPEPRFPITEGVPGRELVGCSTYGTWKSLSNEAFYGLKGADQVITYCVPDEDHFCQMIQTKSSCKEPRVMLRAEFNDLQGNFPMWAKDRFVVVDTLHQRDFFHDFSFLIEGIQLPFSQWKTVRLGSDALCSDCTPDEPRILWTLRYKNGKTPNSAMIAVLAASEDPREAARYEAMLKASPAALTFRVKIPKANGSVVLEAVVNPVSLVHSAIANMSEVSRTSGRLATEWRLVADIAVAATEFEPFRLRDTSDEEATHRPDSFKVTMRQDQLRSLAWMLRQENEPRDFFEIEVEEESAEPAGWRMEARASAPVKVRGGVLADDVGFGKTVLCLALAERQRQVDIAFTATGRVPDAVTGVVDDEDVKLVDGRIRLRASLIIVPAHLTAQWESEMMKFIYVGCKPSVVKRKIIVISSMTQLKTCSIKAFMQADYIIVSSSLNDLTSPGRYFDVLAAFSGITELLQPCTMRARTTWYENASKRCKDSLPRLMENPRAFKAYLDKSVAADIASYADNKACVPSKHLKGAAFRKAHSAKQSRPQEPSAQEVNSESAPEKKVKLQKDGFADCVKCLDIAGAAKDWKLLRCVPFECFEFARIICDEYSFNSHTPGADLATTGLKANAKWLLSATPPLDDFADGKIVARQIGVNLGIDAPALGITTQRNIKEIDSNLTHGERFRSFRQGRSAQWHLRRHQGLQIFLDQFVRRNMSPPHEFETHNEFLKLPPIDQALYAEMQHYIGNNGFEKGKPFSSKHNPECDRKTHINLGTNDSVDATEILIRSASALDIGEASKYYPGLPRIFAILKYRHDLVQGTMDLIRKQFDTVKTRLSSVSRSSFPDEWVSWKSRVQAVTSSIPDPDTLSFLDIEIRNAEQDIALSPQSKKGVDRKFKHIINELDSLSAHLVDLYRAYRFISRVARLHNDCQTQPELTGPTMVCEVCHKYGLSRYHLTVFVLCGHVVCQDCVSAHGQEADMNTGNSCPVSRCLAENAGHQRLSAKLFCHPDPELLDPNRGPVHRGYKIEHVAEEIKLLTEDYTPRGSTEETCNQALVFVQNDRMMLDLMDALERLEVLFETLHQKGSSPDKKLVAFQGSGELALKDRPRCLLLKSGDVTAAGSNLTIANHIIFVSPLYKKSASLYAEGMRQAIGRSARWGQQNLVHVWHYSALYTAETDIFEHRNPGHVVDLSSRTRGPDIVADGGTRTVGPFASELASEVRSAGASWEVRG